MPTEIGLVAHYLTVFWHCWLGGRKDIRTVKASDVVWDRRSYDKTGPRPKKDQCLGLAHCGLVLGRLMLCCETTMLCTLVVIMIVKDTATFQVLCYCFSILCCGTSPLWRSTVAFTYLNVKCAKCLCSLSVVLVFNLVLFTSLVKAECWYAAVDEITKWKLHVFQRSS